MNQPSLQEKLDAALRALVAFVDNEGYWPYDIKDADIALIEQTAKERGIGKDVIYHEAL